MSDSPDTDRSQSPEESRKDRATADGEELNESARSYGLSIKSFHQGETSGDEDADKSANNKLRVDVVHVASRYTSQGLFKLGDLIDDNKTEQRELEYRFELSSLLAGEFTNDVVELEARRLLRGLIAAREQDAPGTRRVIIFVAYDVGALIVHMAFAIAARYMETFASIFNNTSRIVFSGCPQRSSASKAMELKLFQYLQGKKDEALSRVLTTTAIHNLATTVLQTSQLFINSKITLRCRVVSLYAGNNTQGKIHQSFDRCTATLGIAAEVAIQEQEQQENVPSQSFPSLQSSVYDGVIKAISPPHHAPLERTLFSLAAPNQQHDVARTPLSDSIIENTIFKKWSRFDGVELMYIHATDYRTTRSTIDQIIEWWEANEFGSFALKPRVLSFAFDSKDPLRNSIPGMVPSVVLQSVAGHETQRRDEAYVQLHNNLLICGGWTDKSCTLMLQTLRRSISGPGRLLLLDGFDECSADGRRQFLEFVRRHSSASERPFRLLVTSRKPAALLEELQEWPAINVDKPAFSAADSLSDIIGRLTDNCPLKDEAQRICQMVESLRSADEDGLLKILELLQDHTGWPQDLSLQSLTNFTSLLAQISPKDSPAQVLNMLLMSNTDYEALRWVFKWLVHSCRPLSQGELIAILSHRYHQDQTGLAGQTSALALQSTSKEALGKLTRWLRGLVDFSNDQVMLRPEIREIIEGAEKDAEYIWSEGQLNAHEDIAEFCVNHLASEGVQGFLNPILNEYRVQVSRTDNSSSQFIAPIVPDGQALAFYAVQFLPHHISKSSSGDSARTLWLRLVAPGNGLGSMWAMAHWAMSNPFSRNVKMPESPLPLLAGLGLLSYEEIKELDERAQCFIAVSGRKNDQTARRLLQHPGFSVPILMDALVIAIQADDESLALEISNTALELSGQVSPPWPRYAVSSAAWLGLDKLLEILLSNGARTDPETETDGTGFWAPSPLYQAAGLGHSSCVRVLLSHGASTAVQNPDIHGCLQNAAVSGDPETINHLATQHPALLESKAPTSPLYKALQNGNWKAVEALLQLKMDPNAPDDIGDSNEWLPIQVACDCGYAETAQVLLKYGADPNQTVSSQPYSALWFGVATGRSVQCVRYLLQYDADPNHKSLQPSLFCPLARTVRESDLVASLCDLLLSGKLPVELEKVSSTGLTPLMEACHHENVALVKWLLQKEVDVNQMVKDGQAVMTALSNAVTTKNISVVRELLKYRPEMNNLVGSDQETILQIALPSLEMIELLLEAGASPLLVNISGSTLLNSAIGIICTEVVKMLVERKELKVDVHHRDQYGWSPICDAVGFVRDAGLVRLLADNGANLQDALSSGAQPVHLAVHGPPEIMRILLEFRKSIDIEHRTSSDRTPLLYADSNANTESLELLVKAGANINAEDKDGRVAVHFAASAENDSFLAALCAQKDVDVNRVSPKYGSPLQQAGKWTYVSGVMAFLQAGADVHVKVPDVPRATALMAALLCIGTRDEDTVKTDQIVRTLVHAGADVQLVIPGSSFYSAIFAACLAAGVSTINFLLDEGATTQQADPLTERLPLHVAAANGIENFKAILLSYQGDMMAADRSGKNCLHWAAQFGNVETVDFILSRLGNRPAQQRYVDRTDTDGWTPLCWAARPFTNNSFTGGMRSEKSDWAGVIRSLLKHGASLAVQGRLGLGEGVEMLTPLDLARRCEAVEEIISLLQYGLEGKPAANGEVVVRNEEPAPKIWTSWSATCDICFAPIFGRIYTCDTCPDYDACTKCFASVAIYHSEATKNDGRRHKLKPLPGRDEFKDSDASAVSIVSVEVPASEVSVDHGVGNDTIEDINLGSEEEDYEPEGEDTD